MLSAESQFNDAQLDFYSQRLAACLADGSVKVFDASDRDGLKELCVLREHAGPAYSVAWAHPRFGSMLASCGADGRVLVWREEEVNKWSVVYSYEDETSAVSCLAWGPGSLCLAIGSEEGCVAILTRSAASRWDKVRFHAHSDEVLGVSWDQMLRRNGSGVANVRQLVSVGKDKALILWVFDDDERRSEVISNHAHPFNDAVWNPDLAFNNSLVAACTEDGLILVFKQKDRGWDVVSTLTVGVPVWRLSWSTSGNFLVATCSDQRTRFYRAGYTHEWEEVNALDEQGEFQKIS